MEATQPRPHVLITTTQLREDIQIVRHVGQLERKYNSVAGEKLAANEW